MFDGEKPESINIVPDVFAYAQQCHRKGMLSYDVVDTLRTSKAFDNIIITKLVDFNAVQRLELLSLVDCSPFDYLDRYGCLQSKKVLFFKGKPVCLITKYIMQDKSPPRTYAQWANRAYYGTVLEELLKHRREIDVILQLCIHSQLGISYQYENAFVLIQGDVWVRINHALDGVYENILLVRSDNLRRYVKILTLTEESAKLVGQTNSDNASIEDFTHPRKDFDDDFIMYRKVETNGLLPFHVDEMRFR